MKCTSKVARSVLFMICVLFVTSCLPFGDADIATRAIEKCDEIAEQELRALPLGTFELVSTQKWLMERFPNAERVSEKKYENGNWGVSWAQTHSNYLMKFDENKKLQEIQVFNIAPVPRLADVLHCFGMPTEYEIGINEDEVAGVRVVLWYPELGFAYFGRKGCNYIPRNADFKPDENLAMESMHIYGIGEEGGELLARSYERDGIQGYEEFDIVKNIKAWPGSIDKIESVNCDE